MAGMEMNLQDPMDYLNGSSLEERTEALARAAELQRIAEMGGQITRAQAEFDYPTEPEGTIAEVPRGSGFGD